MKHRLLALAAAGALCLSLCGFSGTQPLPDTITVQGTGIVEARPDQTKFTAGVNVVKPTAAEAVSAGSEMAAGVRQALMDAGVPEENIITDGLWLWEHYTYTNYTSYRDGYEYRVSFTVKVPEGTEAGAVLDAAVAGGATSTGSLTQTVSDAGDLYTEALGAAVESARQSAEKLAAASGKTVGKALYITESGYGVAEETERNNPDTGGGYFASDSAQETTPILPGLEQVEAQVEIVFELV